MAQLSNVHIFQMKRTPTPWRRLWGTGLTTALGMAIGLMLGHLEWGIWAFMGGFASLYVQNQPYRARGVTLGLVGLGLALSMALGAISHVWWEMALALGFVSAAGTYFTGAFDVPLPAGFMFILVACISAALPLHPPGIVSIRVISVLGGAAIAWLVGMSDWLWDRHGPTANPVKTTFKDLATYVDALGTAKANKLVYPTARSVSLAHRASLEVPSESRLRALALAAENLFRAAISLSTTGQKPESSWSHRLRIIARHTKTSLEEPFTVSPKESSYTDEPTTRFRDTLREAWNVLHTGPGESRPLLYHPSWKEHLAHGLDRHSLVLPAVLRIGIAVMASVLIAHLLGLSHPFWVPLTCAAVLQGVSTVVITQRTVQRALGTMIGLLLTGALLAMHPVVLVVAVLVIILQLGMLLFIAKNYGISVMFITSMALIIIYAGTHAPLWPMMWARFFDTLLGGAVGLLAAFFLWGRASSTRLPGTLASAVETTEQLLHAVLTGSDPDLVQRRRGETLARLLAVRHFYETALGELPETPQDSCRLFAVERLGYLVLSICDAPHAIDAKLAKSVKPVFEAIARRIEGVDVHVDHLPRVSRYPALERQLQETLEVLDIQARNQASQSS